MNENIKPLRPGALRAKQDGQWITANPHDPLFSTVTMIATEYYDGEAWQPIEPDVLAPYVGRE